MPTSGPTPVPGRPAPASYTERLTVPPWWWLLAALLAAMLGAEFAVGADAVGLPTAAAVVGYVVFGAAAVFLLLFAGAVRVGVQDGSLIAGRAALPLTHAGEVRLLDRSAMRALMGPHTDPAAWTVTRPWVRGGLAVVVTDPADDTPYWLISSRHPAEFAAALAAARTADESPAAPVLPGSQRAAEPGA